MAFEQNRNAALTLIGAPFQYGVVEGVTAFAYDHATGVQRRGAGAFGKNRPIGITDRYEGVTGSMDVEGTDGVKAIEAYISRTLLASFVGHPVNKLYPFWAVANVYDDDGTTPLRSYMVYMAKLAGKPVNIGGENLRYAWEALIALDFHGKALQVDVTNGAATPVTAHSFGAAAALAPNINNDSRYAQLVLRQASDSTKTVTELALTSGYTETSSGLTLVSGLATNERLLTVSVKA